MILGFYRNFNKKTPTYFREKIKSCVKPEVIYIQASVKQIDYFKGLTTAIKNQLQLIETDVIDPSPEEYQLPVTFKPKRHTIREDKSNRWKVGRKISMVYRGPKYSIAEHFNKDIGGLEECRSVQRITIKWRRPTWLQKDYGDAIPPFTLKVKNQFVYIYIDGKLIGHKTLKQLAINDGFESIGEFLRYFKKSIIDWKIISWCENSTY